MHNDDAFATMLLMSQISAEKDELVRPLGTAEYYRLRDLVLKTRLGHIGNLIGMDISAACQALNIEEEEAYRLCVLLGRIMQLSYSIERFAEKGIEMVTIDEQAYPARLIERLGEKAPPLLHYCGNREIAASLSVAMIGSSGMRSGVAEAVHEVVRNAIGAGLSVVTGGKAGFDQLAEEETAAQGGRYVSVLAESLSEKSLRPGVSEMIASGRALLYSSFHPDARYTLAHALERNKCIYGLSNAAIVLSCEKTRGGAWEGACSALRNRFTERVYVWENPDLPGNMELIAKGAIPFRDPEHLPLRQLAEKWASPPVEQLSLF